MNPYSRPKAERTEAQEELLGKVRGVLDDHLTDILSELSGLVGTETYEEDSRQIWLALGHLREMEIQDPWTDWCMEDDINPSKEIPGDGTEPPRSSPR